MAWIRVTYKDHNQLELFTCSQVSDGADTGLTGDVLYWYSCVKEILGRNRRGMSFTASPKLVCVGGQIPDWRGNGLAVQQGFVNNPNGPGEGRDVGQT